MTWAVEEANDDGGGESIGRTKPPELSSSIMALSCRLDDDVIAMLQLPPEVV